MSDSNRANSGAGGKANSNLLTTSTGSNTQRMKAFVYDAISEGPIRGLVAGPESVFLNGTPLMEQSEAFKGASSSGDVSYNHSTKVVTDNNSNLFTSRSTDDGEYTISIKGGLATASFSITAERTTLTASSSVFTQDMIRGTKKLPTVIIVPGAGYNGSDLLTEVVKVNSGTSAEVLHEAGTTVSGVTGTIDLVDTIASISGDTATLTNGGGRTVTNVPARITSVTLATNTASRNLNFANSKFGFRNGYRDQAYLKPPGGFGSSSFTHSVNSDLPATDLTSVGVETFSGLSSGYHKAGDGVASSPTGSEVLLTASGGSSMNIADPSEIDQINITFNFPQGMYAEADTGAEAGAFCEFQIFFEHTNDGSNFTRELVFGPKSADFATRKTKVNNGISASAPVDTNNGIIETTGKGSRTPFSRTLSFDTERFQPFTNYRLRIRRLTTDSGYTGRKDKYTFVNKSTLVSINNIVEDKLSYPYTAYGVVEMDAKDFTEVPARSYDCKGLLCKVPTNYFAREEIGTNSAASYTRSVSGTTVTNNSAVQTWDGTFRGDKATYSPGSPNYDPVWTDNPVWVLMDILTNDRYGLGRYVDPNKNFENIDIYQLFMLAKYCDELVPNGKGGTEPRFTCNVYITELAQAQRFINDFISIFRAMLIYFDGKITPAINAYKEPIYSFSQANVIDGLFAYTGTSTRFRHNQVRVSWNNPDNFFKTEVALVEDHENIIETSKIKTKEITAFGCTSEGQAYRLGKWHLLSEKLEKEGVNFVTSINACFLQPGDVIEVQDAARHSRFSGRVSGSNTSTQTQIYLDQSVDFSTSNTDFVLNLIFPKGGAYLMQETATISSVTYFRGDLIAGITTQAAAANLKDDSDNVVQAFWSDNVVVESKVVTSTSDTATVTVSGGFSSAPNEDVIWTVTATNSTTGAVTSASPKSYIITSIQEKDDMQVSISAVEYIEDKFDLVDRGYVVQEVPEKSKPVRVSELVPTPRNVSLRAVPSGSSDPSESATETTVTGSLDLVVSWEHPFSVRESSNELYEFLQSYEVILDGKFYRIAADTNQFILPNINTGAYVVEVRTINTAGNYSAYVKRKLIVSSDTTPLLSTSNRLGLIPKGGVGTRKISINSSSGLVSFSNSTYSITSPQGETFSNTSSNATTHQQAFNGMGASAEAFLLFDASISATGDRLKAVQLLSNTAGQLAFKYIAEVGASNSGLTTATGTIALPINSNIVTGTSTAFTTDFTEGDRVFISSGSSIFSARINFIESNTKMELDTTTTVAYAAGTAISKQSFIPLPGEDFILAKVTTDGSTNYSISETFFAAAEDGAAGSPGSAGLRQVQGYLYYEKTTNTGVAPSTPGSTTYTFSTGDIDGGSGATEVLALADTSATDKWTNSPRTQDVGSTSSFWTVRYSGGESSAGASTCTVSYSTIVAQTAFTGVVTFSGGTTFQEDGSDIFNTTAIDGGNITTGQIDSVNLASTRGTRIDLSNDKIIIGGTQNASSLVDGIILDGSTAGQAKFFVGDTNSFIRFNNTADKLEISTTNFSIASNGDVTLSGNVSAAAGSIGGFTLSDENLQAGSNTSRISLSSADGIHMGNNTFGSAPFRVNTAGALTATNATITGALTATSLDISSATISGALSVAKLSGDITTFQPINFEGTGEIANSTVNSSTYGSVGPFMTLAANDTTGLTHRAIVILMINATKSGSSGAELHIKLLHQIGSTQTLVAEMGQDHNFQSGPVSQMIVATDVQDRAVDIPFFLNMKRVGNGSFVIDRIDGVILGVR